MDAVVQETLVSEVKEADLVTKTRQQLEQRVDSAYKAYLKMADLKREYEEAKEVYDLQKVVLDDIADDEVGMGKKTSMLGELSGVSISKRSKKTEVDQGALRGVLGLVEYLELAKVGVTDARKYCMPAELKNVLTEEQSGARKFTWYER